MHLSYPYYCCTLINWRCGYISFGLFPLSVYLSLYKRYTAFQSASPQIRNSLVYGFQRNSCLSIFLSPDDEGRSIFWNAVIFKALRIIKAFLKTDVFIIIISPSSMTPRSTHEPLQTPCKQDWRSIIFGVHWGFRGVHTSTQTLMSAHYFVDSQISKELWTYLKGITKAMVVSNVIVMWFEVIVVSQQWPLLPLL